MFRVLLAFLPFLFTSITRASCILDIHKVRLFGTKIRGRQIVEAKPEKLITKPGKVLKEIPSPVPRLMRQYIDESYESTPFPQALKNFPDFSNEDTIRFISFGDSGYGMRKGRENQIEVAHAMKKVIDDFESAQAKVHFIASNGDFFYDPKTTGSVKAVQRMTPEEFKMSFTDVYPPILGEKIPFFVWLGNHETDHVRRIEGLQSGIDFNHLSDQYFMLDGHWGVPNLPDFIRVGGINSNFYDDPSKFLAHRHQKQIREMSDYFLDEYPQGGDRLNILFMHHPTVICGKHPNQCDNGLVREVADHVHPFIRQARIQNVYVGHVHELAHITMRDYDLFISGGGGAKLTNPDQRYFPDRATGEFDGSKLFNFHERMYGFTMTTVNKNGTSVVECYGFNAGEKGTQVRLLYSQFFKSFNSFGFPQ